jgi:hypothetical protein
VKVIQATEIRVSKIHDLSTIQETATADVFFNQEISRVPNCYPAVPVRKTTEDKMNYNFRFSP